MITTRTELIVEIHKEMSLIDQIGTKLLAAGYNASNSTLIAVSTDYSSIACQILRHRLSHDGEVADAIGIDVPYPDQQWDDEFESRIIAACNTVALRQNLILVEAAIIRGSNYRNLTLLLRSCWPAFRRVTTTLFENRGSTFKSDFVGEYYDDSVHDLTFWWERPNNHWR